MKLPLLFIICSLALMSCNDRSKSKEKDADNLETEVSASAAAPFNEELVQFKTLSKNPVFEGTGENTWDQKIRERGYILKENGTYHMWYTGLRPGAAALALGYATSQDGIAWTRYADNPIICLQKGKAILPTD